jgi:hypothetical protein
LATRQHRQANIRAVAGVSCLRKPENDFVFAYLGTFNKPPGWPVHLMYLMEAAFVMAALVCVLLAMRLRRTGPQPKRDMVAAAGGASASFGLIMPFDSCRLSWRRFSLARAANGCWHLREELGLE